MSAFVHTHFEEIVRLFPQHTAVSTAEGSLSYENLNLQANRLGHVLKGLGLKPTMTIGTLVSPGTELTIALLAILKAGGVYMPLSEAANGKNMGATLAFTDAGYLIIHASFRKEIKDLLKDVPGPLLITTIQDGKVPETLRWENGEIRCLTDAVDETSNLSVQISPEDAAYIFFTSGSTGTKKAIVGSHEGLWHFIYWEMREFNIGEGHRVSQLSTATFDASLRDFFLPLCSGGTLCIPPDDIRFAIPRLLEWIKSNSINTIHCVPSLLRLFLKELDRSPSYASCFADVLHIIMAGEFLYSKEVTAWRRYTGETTELVNLYGTTETTMAKTFHRIREIPANPEHAIHVGKPIDNTFIAILNASNELCQIGELGDVYILTRFMTKGYLKNDELNRQSFIPNPLPEGKGAMMHRTGDIGRYLEDRSVEIVGRTDDQVKVNGIRIDLADVKEHILTCPEVNECLIIAEKNVDNHTELIAYLVGRHISLDALREKLRLELPDYVIPGYFVLLDELPLNINGKIDRKALPSPQITLLTDEGQEEATSVTERKVEAFWKEVLGVKSIGKKMPFFRSGGNSLKAIQLISRIYKEMNVLIKIDELFRCNTIELMASLIDNARKEEFEEIPRVPQSEYYDMSQAQKRMWVSSESEEEKAVYNIPDSFYMTGDLNVAALYRAVATIVERHEILRTTFTLIEGEPRQIVHSATENNFEWAVIDLSSRPDAEDKAKEQIYQSAITSFDLEKGPLLRITLFSIEKNRHIFLLVMHHIISDAWSMDRFNFEIVSLYNAYSHNRPSPLGPLRIQFKDYAAWSNAIAEATDYQDDRNFWHHQFSGGFPVLELPLDFPREARTYQSATIGFMPDKGLIASLSRLAKNADCSFFMLYLTIFRITMFGISGQKDIIIGSPVASRAHPDLEEQMGFYVNILLLRTSLSEEDSFSNLLKRIKKNTLEAFEHQNYTFDQLVQDLDPASDKIRNLIFDIGYTYINLNALQVDKKQLLMDGLEISKMDNGYDMVKTDIWFKVIELDNEWSVEISYNTGLFRASTIEKFLSMIKYIAMQAVGNQSASLSELLSEANSNIAESGKKRQEQLRSLNLELLKRDES